MTIRVGTLKSTLWFAVTLFAALAFPLQVYASSPYPSLIPYLLIALLLAIDGAVAVPPDAFRTRRERRAVDSLISVYVFLALFNTSWQFALGQASFGEAGGAVVNYLFPLVFYFYFVRKATEREIRAVLFAVVIAGAATGLFFAYDSYTKLALGKVSDYAIKAFEYSLVRANITAAEASAARITASFRSFGLLESHSVSGAWVTLGAFAALALVPESRRVVRRTIVGIAGVMLLLGLNFTAIVAFTLIIVMFEFGGLSLLTGRFSSRLLGQLSALAFVAVVILGGALWIAGDLMSQYLLLSLASQTDLALGTGDVSQTMIGITVNNIRGYLHHITEMPWTLAIGDGFTGYGGAKGGDIGWVETLGRFGLPFFALTLAGLFRIAKRALRRADSLDEGTERDAGIVNERLLLKFIVCVVLLVVITEGHYSVWASKSVLPIVFFSVALYARYVPLKRRPALSMKPIQTTLQTE